MITQQLDKVAARRRDALIDLCLGEKHIKEQLPSLIRMQTANELLLLLRSDPLDSELVQTSWGAEAVSCLQQYIHSVYQKLEPGYTGREFDSDDLAEWLYAKSYGSWSASQLLRCLPEDYITPFTRIRKTALFQTLESHLNQARITQDSVLTGVRQYLRAFEETCNLNVLTCYRDSPDPLKGDYYFVGQERVAPYRYFWRKADIELAADSKSVNPTSWYSWELAEIPADANVLDSRLVFWEGRLCMVWVESHAAMFDKAGGQMHKPYELEIKLSFIALNGSWSPPIRLHLSHYDKPVAKNCRLVAVVLRDVIDTRYPKGRLAVHVTNTAFAPMQEGHVAIYETRDPLLRKVSDESPTMDYLANALFVDPLTVQQKIAPGDFPSVTSSVTQGDLAGHLGIAACIKSDGSSYQLFVQGYCALVEPGKTNASQAEFILEVLAGAQDDPAPVKATFSLNGGWSTGWLMLTRTSFANAQITCRLSSSSGSRTIVLKVPAAIAPTGPLPYIHKKDDASEVGNTDKGAQFLAFNQPANVLALKYVRLNTLIGADLVFRSNISIAALLHWSTQFPDEPPFPGGLIEPNGPFDSSNGLFFWELFFHLPHLVAARLRDEQRFLEAQQWLHYLFDPQAPARPADGIIGAQPEYWQCRPLAVKTSTIDYEANAPTDPDAIAYSSPVHYQIVIFMEYVNSIISWGDWLYRQLTRDSLVEAKLLYLRAQQLMGQTPDTRTVNSWSPQTLKDLVKEVEERSMLASFEKTLSLEIDELPVTAKRFLDPGVIGTTSFKIPVSPRLLAFFSLPGQRIFSLRNNMTLDGKPLSIPLFAAMDPRALLNHLAAGATGPVRPIGGQMHVAAFRWEVLYDAAMSAVLMLVGFGNDLQRLLEQQDQVELEQIRQEQLTQLSDFARQIQEQSLEQQRVTLTALQVSKAQAEERREHYQSLFDENINDLEYKVMEHTEDAVVFRNLVGGFEIAGAAVGAIPTVFGMAVGNAKLGQLITVLGSAFQLAAGVAQSKADKAAVTAGYARRRQEWELAVKQATSEITAIEAQIIAQGHGISAAEANLNHTVMVNAQALSLFDFLKTRTTNLDLYRWLVGQLKTLHFQANDAAVGLCLSAQAALQVETCEFDSNYIRTNVWLDHRHGLTSGACLQADLSRMQSDYLLRFQRRLELVKTISLRQLFDDNTSGQTGHSSWSEAYTQLITTGTLNFELRQLLFDRDYDDHYCRQIKSVEVTLPLLASAFENVKATLLQVSSHIAIKPSVQSLEFLYRSDDVMPPADVLTNMGSGQSVALSTGLDDDGKAVLRPEDRLLASFENSGAVSRWQIRFPWPQRKPQVGMLASLTDIMIKIRYTAKVGDAAFAKKVQEFVTLADPEPELKDKKL
ncbi:neuraminidase-like domain-containing protein [Pseudomonas sp. BGI-2]|uniref:Tc toxin subunit A-related protein n=1 Tax=Pseudomonas sp. BGI-2 TaxID=2528211 RepID=UPI0010331CF3|nr:neuraminidase-like domain-containing protein [Pseudomonas sp. BGI-2]TBN38247.1 insecticidal toxin complex protein TcaB2 [Pseudomonas sp. BGI-2]